jgi:hypothetical protein
MRRETMTRKDYVLIAEALKESQKLHNPSFMVRAHMCDIVATALASDNPRFNRATFLAACGV